MHPSNLNDDDINTIKFLVYYCSLNDYLTLNSINNNIWL